MTIVRLIPPDEISNVWSQVKPFIQLAIAKGGSLVLEEVLVSLKEGRRQLWVAHGDGAVIECALVTQIDVTSDSKILRATAVGGTLPPEWRQILSDIEYLAMRQGCTVSHIEPGRLVRKGWRRMLPAKSPFGLRRYHA